MGNKGQISEVLNMYDELSTINSSQEPGFAPCLVTFTLTSQVVEETRQIK